MIRKSSKKLSRRRRQRAKFSHVHSLGPIEKLEDRTLLTSTALVNFSAAMPIDEFLSVDGVDVRVTATHNLTAAVTFNSADNPAGRLTVGATFSTVSGAITGTINGTTLQGGTVQAANTNAQTRISYVSNGILNVSTTQTGTWNGNLPTGPISGQVQFTFNGTVNLGTRNLTGTTDVIVFADVPGGQIRFSEPVNESVTTTPSDWEVPNDNLAWIGKRVWHDTDGDGIQDNGETGLGGLTVQLFAVQPSGPDTLVETTTTDVIGSYRFTNLPEGNYWLQFQQLNGFQFSPKDRTDDFLDSDVDSRGMTDEFFLRAGQNDGTHDAGMFRSIIPAAPTVTGPNGTVNTDRPTLTWKAVSGAATYDILVYDTATGLQVTNPQGQTGTAYTHPDPFPHSTMQVFVRGVSSSGQPGSWSAPHTFEINVGGVSVPGTPVITGPTGTTSDTTPTITWNAASGAATYQLLAYDINTGQQIVNQSGIASTSFTPGSPWPGTKVQIFVRGVNSSNQTGPWSVPHQFMIQSSTPLPGAVTFTNIIGTTTDTTPTITWAPVSNAATYDLLAYDLNTGRQLANETNIVGTSFTPQSAWPGSAIQVFVRGVNSSGQSGPWSSPPLEFEIQSGTPVPGEVSFIGPTGSTSDNTPTIMWNADVNANTYDLLAYDINTGRQLANETNIVGTSFTPQSAWPGSAIQVFVRGVNSSGQSGPWSSPPLQFDIIAGQPPGAPTLTAPIGSTENDSPTITWDGVTGADDYELFVYNTTLGTQVIHETGFMATSFTPTDPLLAGEYQAFVRASNENGVGAFSRPLNFEVHRNFTGEADSGTTNAQGKVALLINSQLVEFEFVDEVTRQPLQGLSVAVGRDPANPHQAIVTAIDPLGLSPMQMIVLQGNPASTPAPSGPTIGTPVVIPSRPLSPAGGDAVSTPAESHQIMVPQGTNLVQTSLYKIITTGLLPNRPVETSNQNGGLANSMVVAFNEVLKGENVFIPPGLSGFRPTIVEDTGAIPIEDARGRVDSDVKKIIAAGLIGAVFPTGLPTTATGALVAAAGFAPLLQHSPLSFWEAAGATHVTLQKVRFGGLVIAVYIPEFRNGVNDNIPGRLAQLLGLSEEQLDINATNQKDGSPAAGEEYSLINPNLLGLHYRGVTDNAGQDRIFVIPGNYNLHVGGQDVGISLQPQPNMLTPMIPEDPKVASVELVSSADLTGFLEPGTPVAFSAIARDANGNVIPNSKFMLMVVNPVNGDVARLADSTMGRNDDGWILMGNSQGTARVYAVSKDGMIRSNQILVSNRGGMNPIAPNILVSPTKVITEEGKPGVDVTVYLIGPPPTDNVSLKAHFTERKANGNRTE
ncbi:MAG: hypothetical protein Tsb009_19280 [Planctomycetaceae bacterium]